MCQPPVVLLCKPNYTFFGLSCQPYFEKIFVTEKYKKVVDILNYII